MLLQFAFKNYKSFRDEATLDLTVAEPNETPENELDADAEQGRYVARNGEKVLRAAARVQYENERRVKPCASESFCTAVHRLVQELVQARNADVQS